MRCRIECNTGSEHVSSLRRTEDTLTAHAERVEDSVQASLSELRRIEQARIAAVREAKERARRDVAARVAEADRRHRAPEREAAERAQEAQRLAAAHALDRDRDRERERIEAEARAQERRRALEIERQRLDHERQRLEIEHLRALAGAPPRRSRVLLAAMIAVAIAGTAFLAQRQSEIHARHATPALDRAEVESGSLQGKLDATESALEDARRRTARLREQLAAFESERQAATSAQRGREARGPRPRNRDARPVSPPREVPAPRRIELGDCKNEPLGCVP